MKSESHGWLQEVPRCPVCGSGHRVEEPTPSAAGPYTDAIARGLGIDAERLDERFPAFRCRRCSLLWADPWLTARGMAAVYAQAEATHHSGWRRMASWQDDSVKPGHRRWAERLWGLLEDELGAVRTYAEVNCPFWGLLPYLSTRPADVDVERFLLVEPTSCFWSHGCQRDGESCRTAGMRQLGATLLDRADIRREGLRFDALSFVNCLDHFVDPVPVLEAAVAASRRVYVDAHDERGPFRRQHPFVLNARVLEHLGSVRGWSVRDLSERLGSRHRFAVLIAGEGAARH